MIEKEVIGKLSDENIEEKNTSRYNGYKENVIKVEEDENKVVYQFVDYFADTDDKQIDLRPSQK